MALRRLQKWHGAGNDFLVDVREHAEGPPWTPERVRALCARATGVGADGLLVASSVSPLTMTLYNADGSRAEMSGNGIRCFAAAVQRFTGTSGDTLEVVTDAGLRSVALAMDGTSGYASVSMGEVTFTEGIDGALGVANVGNPHVVVTDDASWSDVAREELAEKFSAHVGGANVEFLSVLSRVRLRIRVIERGVGWTLACGTGSCAAAAVARRAGLSGDVVSVENPGGVLRVELDGSFATLGGPVQFVADVEWLDA